MKILKHRVLVTGAYGLLGSNLLQTLSEDYERSGMELMLRSDFALPGIEYIEGDLTDRSRIIEICKAFQPNLIFNAAAYTNVDKSETEREVCWNVNVDGVANLAYAAKLIDARVIHVSTDYVFDGTKKTPYKETDRVDPQGFYARSKLAGENALIASGVDYAIARTMILYGYSPGARLNFATWVIEQLQNGKPIRIVDDQIGQPTLASELAEALVKLARSGNQGIYHICGKEAMSRYDFTIEIAKMFGLDVSLIQRIKTAELNQPAPRPMHSVFDLSKLESELDVKMSTVREGLQKLKASYPI
ncbi:MAG: dTDP-4-dehydrorhamnose reductase [bacterium]